MSILIIGLLLFLVAHSVRIYAEDFRNEFIRRRGENPWLAIIAIFSLIGFIMIISGYGHARLEPVAIWSPPVWTKHIAALLMLFAFILLVSAYVPGTKIKSLVGHPMILSVKIWAFAHLLANGMLADILLFGSFLIWAILDFRTAKKRDRELGTIYKTISLGKDLIAVGIGFSIWVIFATILHGVLIGVKPFG